MPIRTELLIVKKAKADIISCFFCG